MRGPGTVGPKDGTDPFALPTYSATSADTAGAFKRAINGAHARGSWLLFLIHTLTPTEANWYSPIPVSAITRSVEHALSLGDVWVDSMAVDGGTLSQRGRPLAWDDHGYYEMDVDARNVTRSP